MLRFGSVYFNSAGSDPDPFVSWMFSSVSLRASPDRITDLEEARIGADQNRCGGSRLFVDSPLGEFNIVDIVDGLES